MAIVTAIILGVVQGVTEIFPLSSLGILVILPRIFRMVVPATGARYLPFLVALHLGTALAMFIYFFPEWYSMIKGFFARLTGHRTKAWRLLLLVVIATIPAGIAGLLLKTPLTRLFGHPAIAAAFLVVNGFLMWFGDYWHRRQRSIKSLEKLSVGSSFLIGMFQILALIPGMSRSGSTITGSVGMGLSYKDAARFTFLMAMPIILAAALVEVPKLSSNHTTLLIPSLVGAIVAAVTALFSTRFLMKFFEHHRLRSYALLSIGLGIVSLLLIH